ncbi:MAG: hypothetical protein HOM21_01660, partial [Halobacteriovoraceae bacterium]|nr:hypothetical protein [Halobacteriovoraceae bacterium]
EVKKLLEDAQKDTEKEFGRFTDIIKSYIDENSEDYFGCSEKNAAGECTKPFGSWDCATPGQKMDILCGVLGLNKNKILGDFFTRKNGSQDQLKNVLRGKYLTKAKKINEVGKVGPYTIINQGDQWAVKIGNTTSNLTPEKVKMLKSILARNKKAGEGIKAGEAMFIFGESMAMTRLETEMVDNPGLGMTGIALYRNGSRFVNDMVVLRKSSDAEDQKRKDMMAEAYRFQALMQMAAVKKSARKELLDQAELSLSKYNKIADQLESSGKKKLTLDKSGTLRLPYFDSKYVPPVIMPIEEHEHIDPTEPHEESDITVATTTPTIVATTTPLVATTTPAVATSTPPTIKDPLMELKLQYYGTVEQRTARLKALGTSTSTTIFLDDGMEYYIKSVGDDGKLVLLSLGTPPEEITGKTIENVYDSKTTKTRMVKMGVSVNWEKEKFSDEDFAAIKKFFEDNKGKVDISKLDLKFKTGTNPAEVFGPGTVTAFERDGDDITITLKDGSKKTFKKDSLIKLKYDGTQEKEIKETYYRTYWGMHLENTREIGKDLDLKKPEDRVKYFANLSLPANSKKASDMTAFIDEKVARNSPPNRGEFLYRLHVIAGDELVDGVPASEGSLISIYDKVYGKTPDPKMALEELAKLYQGSDPKQIEQYERARDMLGLREDTPMRYGPDKEVHPYIQVTKDKKKVAEIVVSEQVLTLRSADGVKDIDPKLFEAAAAKPLAPFFQYRGPGVKDEVPAEPTVPSSTSTPDTSDCKIKFEIDLEKVESDDGSVYFSYKAKLKGDGYEEFIKESKNNKFTWACKTKYEECKEKTSDHDEEVKIPNIHKYPYNMRISFGNSSCSEYAYKTFTVPKRECGELSDEDCEVGVGEDESLDSEIEPFQSSGTKFPPVPPQGIQLPPNPLSGMFSRPFI